MGIDSLVRSADQVESFLHLYEHAGAYCNLNPHGEPQLGKRGLYPNMNSHATSDSSSDGLLDEREQLRGMLYALNYSDEPHSALDISERLGWGLDQLVPLLDRLEAADLLAHSRERKESST